jgi:hypothetical protein
VNACGAHDGNRLLGLPCQEHAMHGGKTSFARQHSQPMCLVLPNFVLILDHA